MHKHTVCDSCFENENRKQEAKNQRINARTEEMEENYNNCPKIDQKVFLTESILFIINSFIVKPL